MNIKRATDNISGDIVVIGAGGAGLAAAVSAAEHGAKNVIVLEKASKPGGNSASVGCIFAVNSPLQKRLGINASADVAFREKIANCNWKSNARLIRNTINISGDIIQWLEDKGMEFKFIMRPPFATDAPQVAHDTTGQFGATGRAVLETLKNECQKHGIKILCDTRAARIITGAEGKVYGIVADTGDGKLEVSVKAIILATGGFGGNPDMINKYFPSFGHLKCGSVPQVTGDGLVMAEEIGAIIDDRLALLLLGPFPDFNLGMVTPELIYVNKEGERYYDESAQFYYNPDDVSNTVCRQRDKTSYALMDSQIKQRMVQLTGEPSRMESGIGGSRDTLEAEINKAVAEGKAIVSGLWDEIAKFIEAKPAVLRSTIEQYNTFCDNGYDADFLKDPKYLIALRTPPYYALACHPGINTTFGGIKINHRTQVLNKQDIPIDGLYAAGDNAGSWAPATYSHRYPGSAMSFALCSGYIAGENAAKFVLKQL